MGDQENNVRETRSLSASRAQSSRDGDHSNVESDQSFEDFVKIALTALGSKIDKLLTGQSALEKKFTNLETKVNSNSTQIQDIIQSLDFESDTIKDQASQIQDLTSKLEKRDDELHRANHAIATMESEINALERYTRGFNIRIMGITEEEGEDCVSRVHQVLNAHFGISDHVIENVHRVGRARQDHPRQVIARFHSRAIRRDLMMGARDKLKNTDFRITDDLTAKDLEEKRRLVPLMNKLYQEKQRPRFVNGRLYANGKPVSRENINSYLAKLANTTQNGQAPS